MSLRPKLGPPLPLRAETLLDMPWCLTFRAVRQVQLLWHRADLGPTLLDALHALSPLLPPRVATSLNAALATSDRQVTTYTNKSWALEFKLPGPYASNYGSRTVGMV